MGESITRWPRSAPTSRTFALPGLWRRCPAVTEPNTASPFRQSPGQTRQRSKGIDEIDAASVGAVVTLCAEEVCPVFFGKAVRLHWGLADPARAAGDDAARVEAFRATRDELFRRLKLVFDEGPPSAGRAP